MLLLWILVASTPALGGQHSACTRHFGQLNLIISSICRDFGVVWGVHPYPSIIYQVEVRTDESHWGPKGQTVRPAASWWCFEVNVMWWHLHAPRRFICFIIVLFHCKTYFHCFFLHRLGSDSHSCGLTLLTVSASLCLDANDTSMLGARVSMPNHHIFHLHLGDS